MKAEDESVGNESADNMSSTSKESLLKAVTNLTEKRQAPASPSAAGRGVVTAELGSFIIGPCPEYFTSGGGVVGGVIKNTVTVRPSVDAVEQARAEKIARLKAEMDKPSGSPTHQKFQSYIGKVTW